MHATAHRRNHDHPIAEPINATTSLDFGNRNAFASIQTVWRAYPEIHDAGHQGIHAWIALVLGSVETIGAVLFLLPQTLVAGGWILLAVFAVAFAFHGLQGDFRGDLLIYAAATFACISNLGRRNPENEIAR